MGFIYKRCPESAKGLEQGNPTSELNNFLSSPENQQQQLEQQLDEQEEQIQELREEQDQQLAD
ncbi:uncharacterized protein ACHE_50491S [Aspergillus chevalieri]|uniref:Uncharacterized protein n=1 Tax=Aspergillus chevalieri TaxID=182096 RepID=A0A7R7VR41_ASPCH|nr:uncharacterized protein ACHE_50491S [Aspergillus chevalieri]BCR89293.1 hypothetical protein ACHE_50491S [Aspergillus chevalieri]